MYSWQESIIFNNNRTQETDTETVIRVQHEAKSWLVIVYFRFQTYTMNLCCKMMVAEFGMITMQFFFYSIYLPCINYTNNYCLYSENILE